MELQKVPPPPQIVTTKGPPPIVTKAKMFQPPSPLPNSNESENVPTSWKRQSLFVSTKGDASWELTRLVIWETCETPSWDRETSTKHRPVTLSWERYLAILTFSLTNMFSGGGGGGGGGSLSSVYLY